MSITSSICKHTYQADGQTRNWEFEFKALSAQDVVVYVTSADGTETLITTGYEVNLQNQYVEYPTLASGLSPLPNGHKITLLRTTPLTQEMTLAQQGVLDAKALEQAYDKLTLQVQELAEQSARSIKYLVGSGKTGADAETFLQEWKAQQQTALANALSSIAETKTYLLAALENESSTRSQADITLQQNLQTLTGVVSANDSVQTLGLSAESSARSTADNALEASLSAETTARLAGDAALQAALERLNFITFVSTLPQTGESKYIYAVAQDETDLEDHPIVVLYLWQNEWLAVGAFSTNLDPVTLLTKTEAQQTYLAQTTAQNTYLPLSQKAVAGGVASLDGAGKLAAVHMPSASASVVGGIKQTFDAATGTWSVTTEEL